MSGVWGLVGGVVGGAVTAYGSKYQRQANELEKQSELDQLRYQSEERVAQAQITTYNAAEEYNRGIKQARSFLSSQKAIAANTGLSPDTFDLVMNETAKELFTGVEVMRAQMLADARKNMRESFDILSRQKDVYAAAKIKDRSVKVNAIASVFGQTAQGIASYKGK